MFVIFELRKVINELFKDTIPGVVDALHNSTFWSLHMPPQKIKILFHHFSYRIIIKRPVFI